MKRKLLAILMLMISLSLYATMTKIDSFHDRIISPFSSVAYYGDFSDLYSNPAALPLADKDQGLFLIRYRSYDSIPFSSFSDRIGYINDRLGEIELTFAGNNIALSANIGTEFTNRRLADDATYFDLYSNVDIEIDWGFAFPYVALGMSIKGGNSMARYDKGLKNLFDVVSNEFFSPFERISGSERFSLGAGLLVYFDNFSIGFDLDKILSLDTNGDIISTWSLIGENTYFSFAAEGNKFNKDGDLIFLLPRASVSFSNFQDFKYIFSVKGDLTFQILPDCNVSLGVGYREHDHSILSFDSSNGNIDIFLRGRFWSISAMLGISLNTSSYNTISPYVGVSYTR